MYLYFSTVDDAIDKLLDLSPFDLKHLLLLIFSSKEFTVDESKFSLSPLPSLFSPSLSPLFFCSTYSIDKFCSCFQSNVVSLWSLKDRSWTFPRSSYPLWPPARSELMENSKKMSRWVTIKYSYIYRYFPTSCNGYSKKCEMFYRNFQTSCLTAECRPWPIANIFMSIDLSYKYL